jgi:hypothetical protein
VPARPHGEFLAGEVGEIAGVSGTTIGQWARRGYIRASQSTGDPHVYALEDVAEAAIVAALLRAGVRRPAIRRLRDALACDYGTWPLSTAPLAVTAAGRVVLRENGMAVDVLAGGQVLLPEVPLEDVRLRLTPTPPRAPRRS